MQALRAAPAGCSARAAGRARRCAAMAAPAAAAGLRTYVLEELTAAEVKALMSRPRVDFSAILETVRPIVDAVRERGDAAVREYTQRFDGVASGASCVRLVSELPEPQLAPEVKAAFDVAFENISAFHSAQRAADVDLETMPGVRCRRLSRPIAAVGLYVPGGTAVLPSTALMLSVPARLAGCPTVVLATPPRPDGAVCPEVLYVAKKAGVTHLLLAGGAQAVAAMAFGTQSCPKVDKLFGPGNQYVTAAKVLLQSSDALVAIDMPAGPSEVLVIADADAPPAHVAADLLSQAEHGADSQVVLLALPGFDMLALQAALAEQLAALPRAAPAAAALAHSYAVRVPSLAAAAEWSNAYAPEHLIVNAEAEAAEALLEQLTAAGSVFLGRWTPESVGDYASGTNHVLPTYGYARMYSGVGLDAFQTRITVQALSRDGLRLLGPSVAVMARAEGLEAHARAVTLRLGEL